MLEHSWEGCHGGVLTLIDYGAVDLIGHDLDVMLDSYVRDLLECFLGDDRTGGVGRGVQDDHPGPRRDGLLYQSGIDDETVLEPRGDVDGHSAGETDACLVGDPRRIGKDDLITRIDVCEAGHEYGLFRRRDKNVGSITGNIVVPLGVIRDGRPELGDSRGGRVMRETGMQRVACGIYDVGRCREIGLSHREGHNVYALRLHLADEVRYSYCPGCGDRL